METEQLNKIKAQLRLFKGYVANIAVSPVSPTLNYFIETAAEKGLVFDSEIIEEPILQSAIELYGKDGEKWNQTFHKSFQTVLDTPIEKLIAQQIVHYFTVYGLESLDLYNQDIVYIPYEQLEIPELQENVPFIVIHQLTETQLQEKLMSLITSGIALSKQTVEDVMLLSDYIDKDCLDEITNKEIRTAMYEKYNIMPRNNVAFLRYLIYKVTGSTLLIQSQDMIKSIQNCDVEKAIPLFESYVNRIYRNNEDGYTKLSKIFLRYKLLFLAFRRKDRRLKSTKTINAIINKIRERARTHHEPTKPNPIDTLTTYNTLLEVDLNQLNIENQLEKCTVFKEICLLNAINYRLEMFRDNIEKPFVYKIRNGKSYAKMGNVVTNKNEVELHDKIVTLTYIRTIVRKSIQSKLAHLKGKTVYMPTNISYTAPISEKQFMGNIPEGSYIEIPRESNLLVGIHWKNTPTHRVDLDLHLMNQTSQFGWSTSYRSGDGDIVFSGDITDAPGNYGATELFLIKQKCKTASYLLTVNDYLALRETIPFEIVISRMDENEVSKNYVLNPNNIIETIHTKFDRDGDSVNGMSKPEMTLGYIDIKPDYIRFYFNDFSLSRSNVTHKTEVSKMILEYLNIYKDTQITLKDILSYAEVQFVDTPTVEKMEEVQVTTEDGKLETLYRKVITQCDYNLSLENIDKTTLIDLFTEVK